MCTAWWREYSSSHIRTLWKYLHKAKSYEKKDAEKVLRFMPFSLWHLFFSLLYMCRKEHNIPSKCGIFFFKWKSFLTSRYEKVVESVRKIEGFRITPEYDVEGLVKHFSDICVNLIKFWIDAFWSALNFWEFLIKNELRLKAP